MKNMLMVATWTAVDLKMLQTRTVKDGEGNAAVCYDGASVVKPTGQRRLHRVPRCQPPLVRYSCRQSYLWLPKSASDNSQRNFEHAGQLCVALMLDPMCHRVAGLLYNLESAVLRG